MAHQPLDLQIKTGNDIHDPTNFKNILTALVKADRTSSLLYLVTKKGNDF